MGSNLKELPKSDDIEIWGDGEKIVATPKPISLCSNHTKNNWMLGTSYVDNNDGTISCTLCGWGFLRPGYIKVKDGKIVDLRFLTGEQPAQSR